MASKIQHVHNWWCSFNCSVADPDPNPDPDPIRIHRIHMFLGLLDSDPDPLIRSMDPDPAPAPDQDPSNIRKNSKKTLDFYCFVTSFYRSMRNYDVATS